MFCDIEFVRWIFLTFYIHVVLKVKLIFLDINSSNGTIFISGCTIL